ncbi:MBL fold metallo-hydrolase [Acetobacterium sp.]|jgi:L-ascorbate metabolism protein UlaG (beta-lactamase superfamily)|uniref:MBL fold metallo-hydrolase n=1 Tax=Acetobacterium sp. TaxID=1872094 RepID=UPI000CAC2FBA|nr:MBL fold metallo-hydrolase [Acetobacterium sp.]MDO9491790.1 MBL fold metallo-hydrolase [Acetobacterium sp.]PKM74619.1 MAG: MBL fold metallo-hydrolase [Firmicutes bacterium HGW-Firmicutes-17]
MGKLLYQGHGSYRLVSDQGIVIYIDPFAGDGYGLPADIVLITHEHPDHNNLSLLHQKESCVVLRPGNILINGVYETRSIHDIAIQAVPAYNSGHDKNKCVGYVIELDGINIYASGDTSTTDYMKDILSKESLDYALLPIDGFYNMDPKEASDCAAVIGAVHTIPIHMKPGALFDRQQAESFVSEGRLILAPNEEIKL